MSKQYGLIIPNKDSRGHRIGQVSTARPSAFDDDSDSDTPTAKPTGFTKSVKKQDIMNQKKAIEEDPTVFQYDEIYDKMDQAQKESKLSRKDLEKKPKYISRLLAAAEKRKRENERRIERQVQKEREEEGEEFKDKESFVTSAYKKKLEELRELEEQEKREEYLETIGDVRKQGNLDGFYRHLYDQKVNYEDKMREVKEETAEVKKEVESDGEVDCDKRKSSSPEPRNPVGGRSPKRRRSSGNSEGEDTVKHKKDVKSRKYRARRESEDDDKSDDENEAKKQHLPSNLDADSDFSIDSSDSEENTVKDEKKNGDAKNESEVIKNETEKASEGVKNEVGENTETKDVEKVEEKVEVKSKKPKVDIWKKRTIGEKFDEALKRYFERKAIREAGL